MNEKQKEVIKLLWDFESLREEHIKKYCDCKEKDINKLIAINMIEKDVKTNILKYKGKEINNKSIVAFDVVMEYLERNPVVSKNNQYPIIVSMKTNFFTYDIIVIGESEIEELFNKIDEKSKAERRIIIIETKQYIKRKINTEKPCYICIYPPLDIVDRIN